MASETGEESMDVEQQPPFETINILQIVKTAQDGHGLRYSDYNRYGKYCTSKLHRLRRSLKFGHQYKCVRKGISVKFKKRPVTEEVFNNEMFAQIHLFEAERRWAWAMNDQTTLNVSPEKLRKRLSQKTSLKRAVLYATQLEELIRDSPRCDAWTKLEARAYASWLLAVCCIELRQWRKAADALKAAQNIYKELIEVAKAAGNEHLLSMYNAKCNEIKPQLRLCEHNASEAPASVESVGDLIAERLQITSSDGQERIKTLSAEASEKASSLVKTSPEDKEKQKKAQAVDEQNRDKKKKTVSAKSQAGKPKSKANKPLFYDLAEFCILMPDLESRISVVNAEVKSAKAAREAKEREESEKKRIEEEKKREEEERKIKEKQEKAEKKAAAQQAAQQAQGQGKKKKGNKNQPPKKEEEKPAEDQSGLSGMVKGWIWGSK